MNHISDTSSYIMLEDSQDYVVPVRAKKRRLDHLSWEEKLQRKKLKNRVAAQTSRDRKKAKMDQMETTVNNLMVQNDAILSELEKLKRINEKLVRDNKELTQKLREPCQPSAARSEQTLSSDFEYTNPAGALENCDGLPSLPDLLEEITSDVDFAALGELTQSLLEDIARDLETAAQETDSKESNAVCGFEEMVGKTSEQLEPSGSVKVETDNSSDLSEFLLLHHDYSKSSAKKTRRKKLKTIKPKVEVKSEPLPDEIIYGTLDEDTNTITILVDDCDLAIGEDTITSQVECYSITNDHIYLQSEDRCSGLRPTTPIDGSNFNSDSSDCGYESFGSSSVDLCVSELFPSLM